jgi:TonB family protein
MVQPIWQVLTDLGIEGEYCLNAVDAVEKVTTQLFQIVITDWEDQPEAAFLLKTARDLKASQRPLTLAIVSDDARLPEALRAGANSVLVKPIRAEQVRDTMSTACELLRAKQQSVSPQPAAQAAQRPETAALAAAASAAAVSVPASVPSSAPPSVPFSVTQAPEKTFRAGEFLQSPGSAPGAQFDTESEVQKSLDQAAAAEVDALTELEPMASAVEEAPAEPAKPQEPPAAPQTPLTGWASLQARLTRPAPPPVEDASAKSELLSYGETPSQGSPAESSAESKEPAQEESQPHAESKSESALFAYISGESPESSEPAQPRSKSRKFLLVGILAVACVVLAAVPRTRQGLRTVYRSAFHLGGSWLNPPPAPLSQAVAQHDSFGQSGDEYKLPTPANIPDAATDPSQIRVLPVVDPTAKPEKGSEANAGQAQANTGDNNPADQGQAAQATSAQAKVGESQVQVKDSPSTSAGDATGNAAEAAPGQAAPTAQIQPAAQPAPPQPRPSAPPMHNSTPPAVSAKNSAGIPSSLKSQLASTTPESSGAKPIEAAMSSIEPVSLPESAARDLLTQPVDPEYPLAAKASGQRGSVVLQVLIGRDGAVQDAKFLQGSLVFARAAIDAVKQWRFKPYTMNGRAVSVQSVITLNFKPPA